MNIRYAVTAAVAALIVGGCGSSNSEPEQPEKNQLTDSEHDKVPALIVDRWADCFNGLDEGSIARDGDGNRYTALLGGVQQLSWRVGKGNTGDILTVPVDETATLAAACD